MRRFGWMFLLILTVGCSVNSKNSQPQPIITETGVHVTVFPNYIAIVAPGYELTCLNDPIASIQTANGWLPLEDFIMQPHYLDDILTTSFGMCDLAVCNKIDQLGIPLKLYEYIGERKHLDDDTGMIELIPAYRTVYPTQTVKLDITYFLDEACSKQQTYSTTIDLSN